MPWRSWRPDEHATVRDGRFELHGLDPNTEVPVYFLDPKRKLGVMAHFSGKSTSGGPVTVRLEPCGAARARLVGPDGKPIGSFSGSWLISMVVTPDTVPGPNNRGESLLMADQDFLTRIDTINYQQDPATDAQGRIVFPALIPGATYRIVNRGPRAERDPRQQGLHRQIRRDARPRRSPDREAVALMDLLNRQRFQASRKIFGHHLG